MYTPIPAPTLITPMMPQDEEDADEALVEALLEEAQQDPRPLHIIYQVG